MTIKQLINYVDRVTRAESLAIRNYKIDAQVNADDRWSIIIIDHNTETIIIKSERYTKEAPYEVDFQARF